MYHEIWADFFWAKFFLGLRNLNEIEELSR